MSTVWLLPVLNMDGASIFRVRTKARARVSLEMVDINLHKNEVEGYAYNDARICVTQIKRVLERQIFEDLVDGMKGLASETPNELTNMKSTVSITRKHILREFKKVADEATAGGHGQLAAAIKRHTHRLCIRPSVWTIRLQQDAAGANGMRRSNPQKNG